MKKAFKKLPKRAKKAAFANMTKDRTLFKANKRGTRSRAAGLKRPSAKSIHKTYGKKSRKRR